MKTFDSRYRCTKNSYGCFEFIYSVSFSLFSPHLLCLGTLSDCKDCYKFTNNASPIGCLEKQHIRSSDCSSTVRRNDSVQTMEELLMCPVVAFAVPQVPAEPLQITQTVENILG